MSWWPLAEAVLVGALAGLIGVQVVLRKLSFFTMALTHATFPGVVAAAILGVNIYLGGALAGILVALGVAALSRSRGQNAAAATGVLLSAGFALGVGLVATQNGFSRDLSSFLVGSILTVGPADLAATTAVLGVVAVALLTLSRALTFAGFDAQGARAAGYRIGALDLTLLLLIELVIVAVVPAVGTILALALIVAPAAAARLWTSRIPAITALAMTFGIMSGAVGLLLSSIYNVAAGAAITLVATAILLLSIAATRLAPARHRLSQGPVAAPGTPADPPAAGSGSGACSRSATAPPTTAGGASTAGAASTADAASIAGAASSVGAASAPGAPPTADTEPPAGAEPSASAAPFGTGAESSVTAADPASEPSRTSVVRRAARS